MPPGVSHSWDDESIESKARWFRSLTNDERIAVFESMMEMIFENQPDLAKKKDAQPVPGRILVLELKP